MPTYQGLVSEEGLLQLIEYVKSLQTGRSATGDRRGRRRRDTPVPTDSPWRPVLRRVTI